MKFSTSLLFHLKNGRFPAESTLFYQEIIKVLLGHVEQATRLIEAHLNINEHQFIKKVWGLPVNNFSSLWVEEFWDYLKTLNEKQLPKNKKEFYDFANRFYAEKMREYLLPYVPHDILQKLINETLESLNETEAQIIASRFGILGNKKRTTKYLAHQYRTTEEKIRAIEKKAINKLRLLKNSKKIRIFLNSKGLYEFVKDLPIDLSFNSDSERKNIFLHSHIRNYPMSASESRLLNCFKYAGILTWLEVSKKSSRELLNIKGFGRQCLRQVREIFKKEGFSDLPLFQEVN